MIYDEKTGAAKFHDPPQLRHKLIRTIAEDKLGNIWLGLPAGGVYKWVPENAKFEFDLGLERMDHLPGTQIEKNKSRQ